jgi:FlaA1/EpsC-like NDP-sugar epimerase
VALEFVGARPGEKLHEELWSETETVTPSSHEAILLVTRPPIDADWLQEELDALEHLVESGETLELVGRLHAHPRAPRRGPALGGAGAAAEPAPAP